jgi:hypothetical protein
MSSMTLFGGKQSALLAGVENNLTTTLAGNGNAGSNRRLSIKGGVFRELINGKEHRVNEDRAMNVVLINAAGISRMYFAGSYVEGETTKPMCWSSDTRTPDPAVPQDQRQSPRCLDCKQNIKGSGQGEGRACRFQQRVAVLLDGEIEKREVYQLTLPATSIFGDPDNGKMPLQAYGRHLAAHSTNAIGIVTEMRFDTASPTPKLVFKPVRALNDEEIAVALEMRTHEDSVKAVTLNVSQMDGVIPAPKVGGTPDELFEKPVPKAAAKAAAIAAPIVAAAAVAATPEAQAEEPIPEPKKVVKKSAAPAEEKADLADLVGDWDD